MSLILNMIWARWIERIDVLNTFPLFPSIWEDGNGMLGWVLLTSICLTMNDLLIIDKVLP